VSIKENRSGNIKFEKGGLLDLWTNLEGVILMDNMFRIPLNSFIAGKGGIILREQIEQIDGF
jgi:hypothetical protein